jgi:hypothetical protein
MLPKIAHLAISGNRPPKSTPRPKRLLPEIRSPFLERIGELLEMIAHCCIAFTADMLQS